MGHIRHQGATKQIVQRQRIQAGGRRPLRRNFADRHVSLFQPRARGKVIGGNQTFDNRCAGLGFQCLYPLLHVLAHGPCR
ncbi:hypothetical protein D3C72_1270820 [compost metagenome]